MNRRLLISRRAQLICVLLVLSIGVVYFGNRMGSLNVVMKWLGTHVPLWGAIGVLAITPILILWIPLLDFSSPRSWLIAMLLVFFLLILRPCLGLVPDPAKTYLSILLLLGGLGGLVMTTAVNFVGRKSKTSRNDITDESERTSKD